MKHISKKTWFALSVAIVAMSAVFALKKPAHKEKSSHVVVDRLVNQLVCKISSGSAGSRNYPRGFLKFSLPRLVVRERTHKQRGTSDDYTLRSAHKIVASKRDGRQRHDRCRPIGGDF